MQPHGLYPQGFSVHGILQAGMLECIAIPSPGHLPDLGIKPGSPGLEADSFYLWATSKSVLLVHSYSLVAQSVKNLPAVQETWVQSPGQEDPLEKEMATDSSILAWKIPWAWQATRVGHDLATKPPHVFHIGILSITLFPDK